MTWNVILRRALRATAEPRVTISAGVVGRTPHQQCIITSRYPPAWFAGRKPVTLEIGEGEHAGLARITPGGSPGRHLITIDMMSSGRNRQVPSTQIRVGAWDGISAGAHQATECKFTVSDTEMLIWLPAWAGGTEQSAVATAVAAPRPAQPVPERVPVPAPPAKALPAPVTPLRREAIRPAPTALPARPQMASTIAMESVPMDLDTALEWGRRNGLKPSGNLAKDFAEVNAIREYHSLPLYRLVPPRGRPEKLPAVHVGGEEVA